MRSNIAIREVKMVDAGHQGPHMELVSDGGCRKWFVTRPVTEPVQSVDLVTSFD